MSWQRYAGFGLLGAGAGAGLGAAMRQPAQEQQELLTPEQQNQQLALDLLTPTAAGAAAGLGGAWLAGQLMGQPVEPDRMAAAPEVLRAVDQVVPVSAVVADAPMTANAEEVLGGLMRTLGGMLESGRGNRQWRGFADERERMARAGQLFGEALKKTSPEAVLRLQALVDAVDTSAPLSDATHSAFQRDMLHALYDRDSYRAALDYGLREPSYLDDRSVYHMGGAASDWRSNNSYFKSVGQGMVAAEDASISLNGRDVFDMFAPTPGMEMSDLVSSLPVMADVTPEERRAGLLGIGLLTSIKGPITADARNMFLGNALDVRSDDPESLMIRQKALDMTREELRKQSAEAGFDLGDYELPAWAREMNRDKLTAIEARLSGEQNVNPNAFGSGEIRTADVLNANRRRRGA
jgi:hypothetical protein